MKILFLVADEFGGAGIAARRQMKALLSEGHVVDLESLNSSSTLGNLGLNYRKLKARLNRKYEFEVLKRATKQDGLYKSLNWLPFNNLKMIKMKDYDVIHIHWINNGFIGLNHVSAISKSIKVVWTLHSFWPASSPHHHFRSDIPEYPKFFSKIENLEHSSFIKIQRRVDSWILPSNFMTKGANLGKSIRVIPNCLDDVSQIPLGYYELSNRIGFLCAGDILDPRKGLANLAESWLEIERNHPKHRLYIVGPRHLHSPNNYLLDLLNPQQTVFLNELSEDKVRHFLSKLDALIVPSLEETFGQTILEALSVGTPVIVNKNIESLDNFVFMKSLLKQIDFGNYIQLSESIDDLKNLKHSRKTVSEAVIANFEGKKVTIMLTDLYREVLGQSVGS